MISVFGAVFFFWSFPAWRLATQPRRQPPPPILRPTGAKQTPTARRNSERPSPPPGVAIQPFRGRLPLDMEAPSPKGFPSSPPRLPARLSRVLASPSNEHQSAAGGPHGYRADYGSPSGRHRAHAKKAKQEKDFQGTVCKVRGLLKNGSLSILLL